MTTHPPVPASSTAVIWKTLCLPSAHHLCSGIAAGLPVSIVIVAGSNIKVKHCLQFMRTFAIGLVSGTVSSCVNIPFDVAKSRIQGPQSVPGEIKYRSCFQTMALVYREEKYLALYKGLIPKIMRLGPGGAVMLLVYEYVSDWLQKNL
ncbi:mitochondrial 2-oxodicarboxylate carrier-like [Sinocyclocheilus grahami]|uniref:mitochondrial 2-oxodicarboxylate carrier-like n=1 Tax=Sinocyclocheilus grahami TaxID=75366 RepID=UPI0007ACF9A2|nr:PREDICTED: mitochondrial 2-oxodicarboxylate carrier-like [Sinocyclocheilus grahami]